MNISSVGAELFHADRQTDGRTDKHDKANSCCSQFLGLVPHTVCNKKF